MLIQNFNPIKLIVNKYCFLNFRSIWINHKITFLIPNIYYKYSSLFLNIEVQHHGNILIKDIIERLYVSNLLTVILTGNKSCNGIHKFEAMNLLHELLIYCIVGFFCKNIPKQIHVIVKVNIITEKSYFILE